ncbi:substrate-binding domain-containing protein [Streptomyces ipomoeae]|uniref:substrate-binding domain-containing protein n=1 Tax=Streptomyces ipomoeae TaxID=103232 RepID=UPI0011469115|nr:substrate-binding domain-containing protein [Streptomyces ipomoeae]MDX2939555.1 substrate-binding domain-containing protein [Streptomyces ipomoeae]TQE31022.1 hypothetical protein SipoB123_02845 [Streptomyces ipomoeae]
MCSTRPGGRSCRHRRRVGVHYAALRDAGIPVDGRFVVTVDWGDIQDADAIAKQLSQPEPPTVVYAHSDEVAIGHVRTVRCAYLGIPEDIPVIGTDDHPVAELTDLTTVRLLQLQFAIVAGQGPVSECSELTGRHVVGVRDRWCVACSGSVWP